MIENFEKFGISKEENEEEEEEGIKNKE